MPPAVALLNYKRSCNTFAEFFPNWDFLRIFSEDRNSKAAQRPFFGLMSLKRRVRTAPIVYILACFDKISLLYTVHLQYADDASGVDKMNGVNYRSSYDRWRLCVRSTVANLKFHTFEISTDQLGLGQREEEGGCQHFVCFSVWILPVTLPASRGGEGSCLYLFTLRFFTLYTRNGVVWIVAGGSCLEIRVILLTVPSTCISTCTENYNLMHEMWKSKNSFDFVVSQKHLFPNLQIKEYDAPIHEHFSVPKMVKIYLHLVSQKD
jgi:hypothetical protein